MKRAEFTRRSLLRTAASAIPAVATLSAPSIVFAQNPITLRVSHDEPTFMLTHGVLTDLANSVSKKTNGAVKIEVFPGAQLAGGNLRTQFQQNQAGAIDVAITATSILNNWTTKADVLSLPFLSYSIDATKKIVDSDLGRDIREAVEPFGLHAVDIWARDLRQWVNAKRTIEKPADIRGLKFRVPETALWVATFKALGATPTPMPFGEAFTAVQLGTLDGAERPTEFITGEKWFTVAKFLTISDYTGDALMPTFNKAKWQSLPKDVQDLLIEEFRAAGQAKFDREKAMKSNVIEEMRKNGMTVNILTTPQREEFRAQVAPVWKEWEGKLPAKWIDRARQIVG
jgi:tripartite ATP-independent transporter DctP family solute receptor